MAVKKGPSVNCSDTGTENGLAISLRPRSTSKAGASKHRSSVKLPTNGGANKYGLDPRWVRKFAALNRLCWDDLQLIDALSVTKRAKFEAALLDAARRLGHPVSTVRNLLDSYVCQSFRPWDGVPK
jgi:hypothetical protein